MPTPAIPAKGTPAARPRSTGLGFARTASSRAGSISGGNPSARAKSFPVPAETIPRVTSVPSIPRMAWCTVPSPPATRSREWAAASSAARCRASSALPAETNSRPRFTAHVLRSAPRVPRPAPALYRIGIVKTSERPGSPAPGWASRPHRRSGSAARRRGPGPRPHRAGSGNARA